MGGPQGIEPASGRPIPGGLRPRHGGCGVAGAFDGQIVVRTRRIPHHGPRGAFRDLLDPDAPVALHPGFGRRMVQGRHRLAHLDQREEVECGCRWGVGLQPQADDVAGAVHERGERDLALVGPQGARDDRAVQIKARVVRRGGTEV